MKKILVVCLCVIVGLFSLAGVSCGGASSTNNNNDSGWTEWH